MSNLIEVRKICKDYKSFKLKDISFNLPGGSIMGFIGENGAGKSTTIKAILGLIKIDAGEVLIFGNELTANEKTIKEEIGVVFDENYFHDILNIKKINKIMSKTYSKWDTDYFDSLCERLSIPTDKTLKTMSKGTKTKLSLACALSHRPKLLILDEPTSGLDPIVRDEMLNIFLEFIADEEHSILFSSHITGDLEKIADYITFIHNGEILFSENKDELIYNYGIAKYLNDDFPLDEENIVSFKKNATCTDYLVNNKEKFAANNKNAVIENASIEDIMLLHLKGDNYVRTTL